MLVDIFELVVAIALFVAACIFVWVAPMIAVRVIRQWWNMMILKRIAQSQNVEIEDLDAETLTDPQVKALTSHLGDKMIEEGWKRG